MTDPYHFERGSTPLLVTIPHDGRDMPADLEARLTGAGTARPDTDWHVRRLYGFAQSLGAGVLAARYSRYVVDLNRPPGDEALYPGQVATGLCPTATFAGAPIYRDRAGPDDAERRSRLERYWRPYHERLAAELERLRAAHGYALLWDAHSIRSRVPRLFDGELPVLNLGTNGSKSASRRIERDLRDVAERSPYPAVLNGRFIGGYTTRHYGDPERGVHAVQLEIAQRAYMDEKTLSYDEPRAHALAQTLEALLGTFLDSAAKVSRIPG